MPFSITYIHRTETAKQQANLVHRKGKIKRKFARKPKQQNTGKVMRSGNRQQKQKKTLIFCFLYVFFYDFPLSPYSFTIAQLATVEWRKPYPIVVGHETWTGWSSGPTPFTAWAAVMNEASKLASNYTWLLFAPTLTIRTARLAESFCLQLVCSEC